MKPKHTKRASTYRHFLHIDRILVPIFVPWKKPVKRKKKSKT